MAGVGSASGAGRKPRDAEARRMVERYVRIFSRFAAAPPYQGRGSIVLSVPLLTHACMSAIIDLERLSSFHGIRMPDNHKKAAFIFKWISRLGPVKPLSDYSATLEKHELFANAAFSAICALSHLDADMDAIAGSPEFPAMVYCSMYRDIVPETWALTFYLIERLHPAGAGAAS